MVARILSAILALVLFFTTFAAVGWFFNEPSLWRFVGVLGVWLSTLGACWLAAPEFHKQNKIS